MKRLSSAALLLAAVVATPLSFAQTANAPAAGMEHGSQQMHEQMTAGMRKMQGMQPTGDTDKDFAMMMRMHHQQAIDMAKAEMQHGESAELKAFAQKLIQDQQNEIAQLDTWLAEHK